MRYRTRPSIMAHPLINKKAIGALVQDEFIHSISYSTMALFETYHPPKKNTTLLAKIKELCSIVFDAQNEIFSWETSLIMNSKTFKRCDFSNHVISLR